MRRSFMAVDAVSLGARWVCALLLALLPTSAPSLPVLPDVVVEEADPELHRVGALLMWRGEPFSGVVQRVEAQRVLARTGYWMGAREGTATEWHANGVMAAQRWYRDDRREGVHRGWWPNGKLQFERRYARDLFEGPQRAWYPDGALFESRDYRAGHEEGRQSQWSNDGRLVANYVFRDGRRFGIVGRFDCVTVDGHAR